MLCHDMNFNYGLQPLKGATPALPYPALLRHHHLSPEPSQCITGSHLQVCERMCCYIIGSSDIVVASFNHKTSLLQSHRLVIRHHCIISHRLVIGHHCIINHRLVIEHHCIISHHLVTTWGNKPSFPRGPNRFL